jgi:glycosyltransferase involved in cell wall biosynthesis
MSNKVAVIIPCLNEAKSINRTISEVRSVLPGASILVIDNGSTDETVEIAKKSGTQVLFEPQKGKGFAVRRAFDNIPKGTDAVFMLDGDGTYEVAPVLLAINKVVEHGFDMVVGRRKVQPKSNSTGRREFRTGHATGNKILSATFNFLFQIQISDTLSGWRVFSMGFVNSFPGGASQFEIEAELNAHAHTLSCAITEVDVVYESREEGSTSKLNTYSDGVKILRRNLSLYRSEKPTMAFSLLAFPWLIAGSWLGSRVLSDYLQTQLVPKFPSLIAAIGFFTIAGNLWVTGMILERVRLQRVAFARFAYKEGLRKV